ncbi:predicted protein [Naegleria gruberi]|uniref:Predicted protein n=1 Tax=Naegleria gruberi TaxID=5762 RepID=D2V0H6_NAEGR|nr:uncharacterized protein NAEGRDRAFT_62298 [Naegleria gruberi]EFC49722.1 predicted protein [Naegleria gruberi]|eukprot:XP_002682466.1 predicted protein [Naegleria gruberi strain NEG-M]
MLICGECGQPLRKFRYDLDSTHSFLMCPNENCVFPFHTTNFTEYLMEENKEELESGHHPKELASNQSSSNTITPIIDLSSSPVKYSVTETIHNEDEIFNSIFEDYLK